MLLEIGSHFVFDNRRGGIYIRVGQRDWWWERTGRWSWRRDN